MADLKFTFRRPCLEISGEVGSLAELIGYMQEESTTLTTVFGDDMETVIQRVGGTATETPKQEEAPAAGKPKRTYTRRAASEAVAPDPMPVPQEAQEAAPALVPGPGTPLPPNQLEPNANGVPAFLDRTLPPTPTPPPPPLPAAPPPVGVLGPKIVAALDIRAASSPDGGQALADWLAGHGLTIKGATYSDACRAVLMMADGKLTAAAAQLGV